jgi:hypothetical protein
MTPILSYAQGFSRELTTIHVGGLYEWRKQGTQMGMPALCRWLQAKDNGHNGEKVFWDERGCIVLYLHATSKVSPRQIVVQSRTHLCYDTALLPFHKNNLDILVRGFSSEGVLCFL